MRNIALIILLALSCRAAYAEVPVPAWTKFATDLAGTLTLEQLQNLNERLADLEAGKGAQFAVLIVPSTQPEVPRDFAFRVFESWKLGRKGVDDGVLWVIAADSGRWFIMTGYGMEGPLPDVKLRQIASGFIDPYFKRGDRYAGIDAGVTEIMKVIENEPLPPPQGHSPIWYASVRPQNPVPIPPWTQPVIDLTGTLDPGRTNALNKRLAAYEDRKGAQIGVLIVPTTRTESFTQFTRRVCETWQLGRDGVDDGVIMVLSKDYKMLSIIPGAGLEKALDNPTLAEITNEIVVPNLVVGEYDSGISDGVEAIIKVVDSVSLPPPDNSLTATIKRFLATCWEKYRGVTVLLVLSGVVVLYHYFRRFKKDEYV
jgi:uncharacterized membrane protein YgcG